ncbi:hypothetical protein BDV10DRAFT_178846 [Aspergillus recurvatus]
MKEKRHSVFDSSTRENLPETCLFCLDKLGPDSCYRRLACNHHFHSPCINDWVRRGGNSCPLCRQDLGSDSWSHAKGLSIHSQSCKMHSRNGVFKHAKDLLTRKGRLGCRR